MLQGRFPLILTATAGSVCAALAPMPLGASSAAPPGRANTANTAAAADACAAGTAQAAPQWWLDLRGAPLAQTAAAERRTQLDKINAEQAEVARTAQQLGACVLGSVQRLRNALAVQATAQQIQRLRSLPQVRAVRPLTHIHRTDPQKAQPPEPQRVP